ncbi:hypothetical protein ACTXT7_014895 [Hymenolepis weldensis]
MRIREKIKNEDSAEYFGGLCRHKTMLLEKANIILHLSYGHVVPLTDGGKVYSVIFACIGIPFTLHVTSSINNHFLIPAVDRFRKIFVNWIAKDHKPKKAALLPPLSTLFCFPNVPSTVKVNENGLNREKILRNNSYEKFTFCHSPSDETQPVWLAIHITRSAPVCIDLVTIDLTTANILPIEAFCSAVYAVSYLYNHTEHQGSKERSPKNGDIRTSGDIPSAPVNGVNQNLAAMSQPSVVDAVAPGKVNESFDDADMNTVKSSSKSKSGTAIIAPNSSKEPSDIKRAITLDLRNSSTRSRSPVSVADRGGLSVFTERRKISRKNQSTVSRTSIFVNMRLKHYSVVQPPLNMLDLFRVVRRNSTTRARALFLLLICTIIISITMIFPAALFKLLEPEWTYLDALYFCFISLTTIGFGDFVPGKVFLGYNSSTTNPAHNFLHETYLVTSAVYLITGATLMMLMVRTYRSMMELERKAKRDRLYTKLQHSFTDPASLNRSAPRLAMGRN